MEFVVRIVLIAGLSLSSGSSFNDEVESCEISWKLVESRPVIIKVGFRSGLSCDDKVLESNNKVSKSDDKVEFL